jgi:hypothetical protein
VALGRLVLAVSIGTETDSLSGYFSAYGLEGRLPS